MEEEVDPPQINPQLIEKRFLLLEERVEVMEQQLAELSMGFMEMNVAFETLLWQQLGGTETPEGRAFKERFIAARAGMMGWLHETTKNMGTATEGLDATMARLVREGDVDASPPSSDPSSA